jgi:hypothetical protein
MVEVAHPMKDVMHRDREPTQKIVWPVVIGIGAAMAVLGLLLLPVILLAFALVGNAAGTDPTVYFPVVLIAAGLILVKWGQRYDRTFAIAAPPEKVVLFFLVKTTQRLTVSACPVVGGSTVTIRGEAIDALIGQMQRLMVTSPKGSAIKLPASLRQDFAAQPRQV